MKIFWMGSVYPGALDKIFLEIKHNPNANFSYRELKEQGDASYANYFATGWCKALENIGYETENVISNVLPLQTLWLREHVSISHVLSLDEILLLQVKEYSPDILFVDDFCSVDFLQQVKSATPSIQLVVGWSGSALAKDSTRQALWKKLDVVLCCAPESVSHLRQQGANAFHMNHAFPEDSLSLLKKEVNIHSGMTFIGSVIRGKEFHLIREQLLSALLDILPLEIYSPNAVLDVKNLLKSILAIGLYDSIQVSPKWMKEQFFSRLPVLRRVAQRTERPMLPVNYKLYKHMRPPVYGIEMLNVLAQSDIVLNIHADSSPEYASNQRLFEGTGVGACLLTDNKKNMKDLFIPDQEVVTYDSLEDCIEKAMWLRDHPKDRKRIAAAGANKCLKEHTYQNRALEFDQIVKECLKKM